MEFDLYIFDLDGTLIDTRCDMTEAINEMLSRYGIPPKSVEEVTSYVGDGIKKLVERTLDNRRIELEEAVSFFKESYWRHKLDTTAPYPGIKDLLSRLTSKQKAILTNKAYRFTRAITDGLGLTQQFSLILGGDSVARKKPALDGVEYILEHTGVSKKRTVMIGDGVNDIVVAKKAGFTAVGVTYGFTGRKRIREAEPDYIIDHPMALLDIGETTKRNS